MSPLATSRLRRSRAVDRAAAALITVGGSTVLLAVAFLMVFLAAQCVPLLRTGSLKTVPQVKDGPGPVACFEDEYRENVAIVGSDGTLHLVPRSGPQRMIALPGVRPPVRQARTDARGTLVALKDSSGALQVWAFTSEVRWNADTRVIEPAVRHVTTWPGVGVSPVLAVAGDVEKPVVLAGAPDGATVLSGTGDATSTTHLQLQAPARVGALSRDGGEAWLASSRQLAWFPLSGQGDATQTPQATVPIGSAPSAAAVIVGDVTLLLGDETGAVSAWQVVTGAVAGSHVLDLSGTFRGTGAVQALAVSQRDKAFLVQRADSAEVAYLTSRRTLMKVPGFPADTVLVGFSPRRNGIWAATQEGAVYRWGLDLAYPEATAETLFLPTRYEGFTKPELAWQSTGGSETFEPKLSMIPLLVGTLKGAFYALLFSAPVALAAALFVSQFAPSRLRQIAKPVVEMMAALPSVVVGFLAALLLAPLLQRHIVGTLGLFLAVPAVVVAAAAAWEAAPLRWRRRATGWRELGLVTVVVTAVTVVCFAFEGGLERVLFAGDFK